MVSANIVYEHMSKEDIDFFINPVLKKERYSITNFQVMGEIWLTLLSIKSDDNKAKKPAEILEKIIKEGAKLAKDFNEKRPQHMKYDVYLSHYKILGEYSAPETAEQLFPQIAVEYTLKSCEEKLNSFKSTIRSFGDSFKNI
jgi:hypothetical protein